MADFYNNRIGAVQKLVPNFFIKMYVIRFQNIQLSLKLGLKLSIHYLLEFNQSQCLKPYIEFTKQKRIKTLKNGDKNRKIR